MKTVFLMTAALFLVSCASAPTAEAEPAPQPQAATSITATNLTQEQRFAAWKTDFSKRAIAKNYAPELVRSVISPAIINPCLLYTSPSPRD